MTDKYTLRDFLVYFLTGFFMLLTLINEYENALFVFFNINLSFIEKNSVITIFLLVPGLYLLGQIIHGIDLLIFKIGRLVSDSINKYTDKHKRLMFLWFFKIVNFLINGNRVIGILEQNKLNIHDFWKKAAKLQSVDKYSKSEYWYLTNNLFTGLSLIIFGWLIYFIFDKDIDLIVISLFLLIICWYRARHFATGYVTTINNTWEAIEK